MLNLSATLTLLNARLSQVTPLAPHIDLHEAGGGSRSMTSLPRSDGKDKNVGKVA